MIKFSLFNDDKERFSYDFPVEIETHAHGEVVASCPLLPGARAQGRTEREALERLRAWLNRYFLSAAPAPFERTEVFPDHSKIYGLLEHRGHLLAATSRDAVLKSGSGAPGSWKTYPVTHTHSKFFNPDPSGYEDAGDYVTQIYCLARYAPLGQEASLFVGTNLNGSVYRSEDGEAWHEAFSTGEDRVHAFAVFKDKLYAGTSSEGKVYAYDGAQWNAVGALNETAVTALGVFRGRLYAGTYPSGLLFSSPNGLAWEEAAASGQHFVQCFREFKDTLYAGCSGPRGVALLRTRNGRDWETVYEGTRETNLFCLEVFDGQLWAGTGNSGRVLATRDGREWRTVFAGDDEGVRSFAVFNDFLWAATENGGAVLKSTYDSAPLPKADKIRVSELTSSTAVITWETDMACASEVQYAPLAPDEKGPFQDWPNTLSNREPTRQHRAKLAGLKAGTRYRYRIITANRQSSVTVVEGLDFKTPSVLRPKVDSAGHPDNGRWSRSDSPELLIFTEGRVAGFRWCLDREKDTYPEKPRAEFTDSNRVAVTDLAEGRWWFHVVSVDENGNPGEEAVHYPLLIDTRALPPTVVRCPTHPDPSEWVAQGSPVFEWDPPEDFSGVKGYYVKLDRESGTLPGPTDGTFTVSPRWESAPLEDGVWYLHVATGDEAGNVGSEALHRTVRIDTQAVAPALSSPTHPREDKWYPVKDLRVDWAPPHDLSGVEGYFWALDRDPKTLPEESSAEYTAQSHLELKDLDEGLWWVHVRTRDKAGNLSREASHLAVRIDTVADPPWAESPTHSDDNRWYNKRRVVAAWKDPLDHSGVEGYYYNIDQSPDTVPTAAQGLYTQERSVSFELSKDGLWYFHVTTKDRAGNVGKRAAHLALRVDTAVEAPRLSSRTHPESETWTNRPTAVVDFQAPDDLSGVVAFLYHLSEDENAAFDPAKAQRALRTPVEIPLPHDGVHHLIAVCEDAAGNLSRAAGRLKMRLDTTALPPVLSSPTHPSEGQWYGARRFEVYMTDAEDLSGIEGYYLVFNRDSDWKAEPAAMRFTTARGSGVEVPADGVWWMHVVAKDKAGNLSAPAKRAFRVDTVAASAPVVCPTHPPQRWSPEPRARFQWTAPEELSGVAGYYFLFDRKPHTIPTPETGTWTTASEWTSEPLADGTWYFHLSVKDGVGNVSPAASHCAILVDAEPPETRLAPLPPLSDKTRIPLVWESKDTSSGVECWDVQVRENDGPWTDWQTGLAEPSAVFSGRDGVRYDFRVRARDRVGNLEPYQEKGQANASVTVDVSPPPPVADLRAQSRPHGAVELVWQESLDPVSGTAFYRVYRWVEGEARHCISRDGEVVGTGFMDKGDVLRDNVLYHFIVQPVDRMGNEQHENNAQAACLSDHQVGTPVLTCPTHPPDHWSSLRDARFTWLAPSDATGVEGYYYLVDGKGDTKPGPQLGSFTRELQAVVKDLPAGQRWFHLSAQDRAGNVSEDAAHYALWIDSEGVSAPAVESPTHADPVRWYAPFEAHFTLKAVPKPSGIEAFYYHFDQSPATPVAAAPGGQGPVAAQRVTESEVRVTASQPGRWFFHAAVRDKAGNLSPTTHREILVSGGEIPPVAVYSSTHPKEDEVLPDTNPVFTWEDRADSSLAPVGYFYKLSRDANDTLGPQDSFTTERTAKFNNIEDGEWWFHVSGAAQAGKPGVLSSRRKVAVKRTGRVAGKWVSKDGQNPLGGVPVEAWRGDKREAVTTTGPDGIFVFDSLPEGRYEMRILSPNQPPLPLKDVPVGPGAPMTPMILTDDAGVFPNPPQPGPIKFYYVLKEDCAVLIEIFDAKGTIVDRVTDKKAGGMYGITLWDATNRPEGIYQYKLTAKSLNRNALSRFTVKKFKLMRLTPKPSAPAPPTPAPTPSQAPPPPKA